MSLLLQFITWMVMVAGVVAECVSKLRSDGVGVIVGHRLFANGSLGVIDHNARFLIFDSAGVLFYKENLNLPNDPERTSKYKLVFGMMSSSNNTLYLMSTNSKGFTYSSGGVTQSRTMEREIQLMYWGPLMNFPDFGLAMADTGPVLFTVQGTRLVWADTLDTRYGVNSDRMFNVSYISRSSANPLLNEFYLAIFSNRTFIGTVDLPNDDMLPIESAAAATVITETSFRVITSSIGGNNQYTAFAGYYPWSASNKYSHYLKVNKRSSISVTLQITDYHVWSVALDNVTSTKLYFLTHDGSLYSTTFTASSISVPSLLVDGLYLKYADLEIITPTKLLLRTINTMAIFDIATSTLQIVVDIKPTGARHFGSKMFVLTHNFNVSLYDTSSESPIKDNSFAASGLIKQLIVSTLNNRFYLLNSVGLYTFSLSTYALLASNTLSQLKTATGASSIISLNDVALLVLQPTKLVILAFGVFAGNKDTAIIALNDVDLAYLAHYPTGLQDNFLTVTVGGGVAGNDFMTLFRPNCINVFYYNTAGAFVNPSIKLVTEYFQPSGSPETDNLKYVLAIPLPAGDKITPRGDMIVGNWQQAQVESNRMSMISKTGFTVLWNPWLPFNLKPTTMIHSLQGTLNLTHVFSGPMSIYIMPPVFDLTQGRRLMSDDFVGGVGYQRRDDSLVFFNGEYEVIKINPIECYADPTKGYQDFTYPCGVTNCKYCSAFSTDKCATCNTGKLPMSDYSACLSTCNPGYLLNGMCYNNCPIEYYKYNAGTNTCETPAGCAVARGKLILGDMCNSVASCPTGSSANSSKYCTFASTSASNPTSTALVANPCTGGLLYWPHFSICVNPGNATYVNYTISAGTMYCDGSTHFYDTASKRCLQTCGLYSGIHPQMGLICVTAADCNSFNMFTDVTTSGVKLCTSACSSSLWTNFVAKSCVTACPYPSTYAKISDKTCLSTCGSSAYTLEINKTCLTSAECLTASLIKTPSAMTCTSSCGASLYLNLATSECLTSSQCTSSSNFLSPTDMKCVTTCSGSQYLLAVTSQCLTATECKALTSGSGGGLLSEADKKCVASCSASQYILISSSQCLSDVLCKAVLPGSGGSLLSEGDKRCVASCNSTQFLTSNSECLTEAACLVAGGYGKLSMYDRKCVPSCSSVPQQYWASTTSKCWLSAECIDPNLGNGVTNNIFHTCDGSCSTGLYRLVVSSECLSAAACKAKTVAQGGSLLSEENFLCVNACTGSQYFLAATSQCLSSPLCQSAFGNTGYLDEVNHNCVSSCSGTQYKLESSRQCLSSTQCLAAYSGAGLLSEVDDSCVSSCGSGQYLLDSSKQCLTVSECLLSYSGTGLLSMQDKKCVSACSPTQYLEQGSKSCLTNIECNAMFSGSGILNMRDKTCVSSCPVDLYYLQTTQQCLTANDCHAYAGNTGLTSGSNMKCLISCQSGQYLLDLTKECFTVPECKAYSSNSGLLSESDMKCVLTCQPTQYLLQPTKQCLQASECLDSTPIGGFTSEADKKCLASCTPIQYLVQASSKCLSEAGCSAMGYWVTPSTHLCQPSCLPTEYKDNLGNHCYTKPECLGLAMLTKSSSPNNLCLSACSSFDYLDSDQHACLTRPECTIANNKFVISTSMTCVLSCPTSFPLVVDRECFSSCPVGYFLEESVSSCVQQCAEHISITNAPCCLRYLDFEIISAEQKARDSVVVILEVYFESNSTSTVTSFSVELATLFKQVGIVTDTSTNPTFNNSNIKTVKINKGYVEIDFVPVDLPEESYRVSVTTDSSIEFVAKQLRVAFRNKSKSVLLAALPQIKEQQSNLYQSPWSKPAKWVANTLAATKIFMPLMMATFMGGRTGSFLCLIAQTYTKLMMLTHLNFRLYSDEYSVMYYDIFREFLDAFNESMMKIFVGGNAVQKNKEYVCDKGFEKLCFLTVEDNFFMSHTLALLIIIGQALVVYLLANLLHVLNYQTTGDLLLSKLKNIIFYAFMLESSIEFWFTLLLNALIFVYQIAILAVMKIGGYLILAIMLYFFIKILYRRHSTHNKVAALEQGETSPSFRVKSASEVLFKRLRNIVKEITTDQTATEFLRVLLIHDFIFAALLAPGRYLGDYQMAFWLLPELVLLILASKYRPFKKTVHNVRQILIEFLFLVLTILMTLVPFHKSNSQFETIMILFVSMLILVIDMGFVLVEFVKVIIEVVGYLAKKKKVTARDVYGKSSMISYRGDSSESMKTISKRYLKPRGKTENSMVRLVTSNEKDDNLKLSKNIFSNSRNVRQNRRLPTICNISNRPSVLSVNQARNLTPSSRNIAQRSSITTAVSPRNGFRNRLTINRSGSASHIDSVRPVHTRASRLRQHQNAQPNKLHTKSAGKE